MASMTATMAPPTGSTIMVDSTTKESRPDPSFYKTIDGLIKTHAQSSQEIPMFGYPRSGVDDFEVHSVKMMSRYVDAACHWYEAQGLEPADPEATEAPVMALLTQSGLDAVVSFLALNRMGWAVLFLSTRLTAPACVALMDLAKCNEIIVGSSHSSIAQEMATLMQLRSFPRIDSHVYRANFNVPVYTRACDIEKESRKIAWIIHSSGSTGHPKPIFITNFGCLANFRTGLGFRSFTVSPLFHSHALMEFGRAIYAKQPIFCGNYALPVTSQNLISAMRKAQPKIVCAVPYVLKLLAEKSEGTTELVKATVVMSGGSAVPDVLGDQLTDAGIHLCSNYGATETGFIMNSFRPKEDKEWSYLRLKAPVEKYVLMDEISPGVFECVALDGLPSKDTSNSDSPPKSFRTRDLFTRHPDPAKANFWKYLSRLDDRLTLVNGEKVLPIPIEGHIRQHDLIKEAVVFGFQQEAPGVIIFKSEKAADLTNDEFLDRIWPQIEEANSKAETFSHLPRDLVITFPASEIYPRTDKGTAIRAQIYDKYAVEIQQAYRNFENGATRPDTVLLTADPSGIEEYLLEKFRDHLQAPIESATTDIFSAGVDSLQTARLCNQIRKEVDLGGNQAKLSQNAVFERGTVRSLAQHLYNIRLGIEEDSQENELETMKDLIDKYSRFTEHDPTDKPVISSRNFLLTGVTGGLGSHLLSQLIQRQDVTRIFCLVRASSRDSARERVLASLSSRKLYTSLLPAHLAKITALPSDLSQHTLGLEQHDLDEMLSSLTHIIHSAWAVNFNIPLAAFEQQHIKGVYNMIEHIALKTTHSKPAEFYFCSSISAASATPRPATISETQISDLSHAQKMGYGRSKLVAERITNAAMKSTSMQSRVLRIGQLAGDSVHAMWNDTEAIALMIRSARPESAGCLPALHENPSWLPIDAAATAIKEIIYSVTQCGSDSDLAFHILNPRSFSFAKQLIPMLQSHAEVPGFEVVSVDEWLERLKQSNNDVKINPSKKLLDFWLSKYEAKQSSDAFQDDAPVGLHFDTTISQRLSQCLQTSEDPVQSGLMYKIVSVWMEAWGRTADQ